MADVARNAQVRRGKARLDKADMARLRWVRHGWARLGSHD